MSFMGLFFVAFMGFSCTSYQAYRLKVVEVTRKIK